MITAEYLANSILFDRRGIHVVIWDDKGELVRVLLILLSAIDKIQIQPILLSSGVKSEKQLRELFEIQPIKNDTDATNMEELLESSREELLILFIQQATKSTIGPLLNGWRSSIAASPGSLLVVRNADLMDFLRAAPDLSSFIGPKIIDSSTILSIWSNKIGRNVNTELPLSFVEILNELPGEQPTKEEIKDWMTEHPAID